MYKHQIIFSDVFIWDQSYVYYYNKNFMLEIFLLQCRKQIFIITFKHLNIHNVPLVQELRFHGLLYTEKVA